MECWCTKLHESCSTSLHHFKQYVKNLSRRCNKFLKFELAKVKDYGMGQVSNTACQFCSWQSNAAIKFYDFWHIHKLQVVQWQSTLNKSMLCCRRHLHSPTLRSAKHCDSACHSSTISQVNWSMMSNFLPCSWRAPKWHKEPSIKDVHKSVLSLNFHLPHVHLCPSDITQS